MKKLNSFRDFLEHQYTIQEMSVAMIGEWNYLITQNTE